MAHDAQIASLLAQIDTESSSSKLNDKDFEHSVEELLKLAGVHGLGTEEVEKGYEVALSSQLSTSRSLALLPALLPRDPLTLRPVLLTLSIIGETSHHRGCEYKVQRRALEQLGASLEIGAVGTEGLDALERLFSIVERGLEYKTLREATASILRRIARRQHVQEHRTAKLEALITRLDPPPSSMLRLLELYGSFAPEQVYEQRGKGNAESETVVGAWKEQARAVFNGGAETGERATKRRRTSALAYIPAATTYNDAFTSTATHPYSTATSLSALSDRIDSLSLPKEPASVLSAVPGSTSSSAVEEEEERCRAWTLLLRCGYDGDSEELYRLCTWLITEVQHELYDVVPSETGSARVEDLLCRVREVSEIGGELLEHFEPFLAEFLLTWDGQAHRTVVFDLVALLKPLEFSSLLSYFLRPLETIPNDASPEWIAELVGCLTSLVTHLAARDDWEEDASRVTSFGQLDSNEAYLASLQSILQLGNQVIASATVRHPHSLKLRSAAFAFFETSLTLPLEHDLAVITFPSTIFNHTALLSGELMSLSRMCGLLAKLREALTGENSAIQQDAPRNNELVTALNARLVDFVNALWQRKFLVPSNTGTALGLEQDDLDELKDMAELRGQAATASMGLTTHAALALLAKTHFSDLAAAEGKSTEALVGPVTSASVKKLARKIDTPSISYSTFRPALLEHLGKEGAEGLHDFLFSSLQSLIDWKASSLGGSSRINATSEK